MESRAATVECRPLAFWLIDVRRRLVALLAVPLRAAGISWCEFEALEALREANRLTLKELAERTSLDPPRASRLARGMVRRRLIRVVVGAKDRRQRIFTLTRKGKVLAGSAIPLLELAMHDAEAGVTPHARRTVERTFALICAAAGKPARATRS